MSKVDKYGRGSAAANGEGFVDLAPGDTFTALEAQLKLRIADRFDNAVLGISAVIGSKRNASELAKHLASGEDEESHKFAAKNVGVLFARGQLGVSHDDKKAVVGQRWITRFIRVFTPFRFAGDDYLATLTLKDVDPDKRIYAVEAVETNQDAKSRSTPRGAISEDLNSAPFQDLTSQLASMVSYYVGDVNRTHPKFVGRDEMFSAGRTVELMEGIVLDFCAEHQAPNAKHRAPKFSIVIPVYNVAPYLRECLDSVLAQTFTDWEAICVDDGSTDGSGSILDEYARRQSNNQTISNQTIFRVIHQKNAGVSAARNAALDRAAGEYIVFVDGDDGLVRNALEVLQELIEKSDADIVKYGSVSVESLGEPVADAVVQGLHGYDLDKCGEAKAAYRLVVGDLIAWNGCYRREAFTGVRFLSLPNGEDIVFGAEAFCRARKVAISDARLYRYVRREGSAVRTVSLRHVRSALRAIEETARITKGWKWYGAVGSLLVRKTRTGLVGGVLPKIRLLPDPERIEAETSFYDSLGRLAWDWKSRWAGKMRNRTFTGIFLELPFKVRALLLKSHVVRRLRGG